jgi:Protein of unknown function (DUF2726)
MDQLSPLVLAAILGVVLLSGAWLLVRRRQQMRSPNHGRSRQAQTDEYDTVASWEPTATRVLTTPEREAYQILRKALPEHMLLAQVPLARFLKVPTRNSYSEWMRRVGALCADLVVCDANAQVVAVIEIRQPLTAKDRDRNTKRHARMDKVLAAANIPVHVWLDGALPGPAVARETVLGGSVVFTTKSGATLVDTSALERSRSASGAASPQVEVDLDVEDSTGGDASRRMSTWFESAQSGNVPLDEAGVR